MEQESGINFTGDGPFWLPVIQSVKTDHGNGVVTVIARIIIPDTFLYLSLAKAENALDAILLSVVKNSIGPSLVWMIFQENWYLVSIFNTVCFLFVLIYTRNLVFLLSPFQNSKCYSISLILTLACMYYSVGSLKEIQTLLGFTAFVYCFLKKQKIKALIWLLFLVLFRFQFIYIIIPVYVLSKLRSNPAQLMLISLLIFGMIFPSLYSFEPFMSESVESFRIQSEENSFIGAKIEFVRNNVFGLSLIAIALRAIQNVLEPFILFLHTFSLYEDGSLSLFHLQSTFVLLLMLRAWVLVIFKGFRLKSDGDDNYANFGILYAFLAIAIFTIGGTGLLSHRYLVPVYGLLLVAAHVNPLRRSYGWGKIGVVSASG